MAYKMVTLADGRSVDIDYIVEHPEEFGWEWEWSHLNTDHGRTRVTMGRGAPRKHHTDFEKLKATFGDRWWLDECCNASSSPRVRDQRIREAIVEGKVSRTNERDMLRWIVESELRVRERSGPTTVVYRSYDGNDYASETEKTAADLAHFVDSGMPLEQAKQLLGVK